MEKNSTHGTLAASWGSGLCQLLPKESSPQSVPSGWRIALFLFLSLTRCMVLREIRRWGCSSCLHRECRWFEQLRGPSRWIGGWELHACLFQFMQHSSWVWPWLSCSWFKSELWLDIKLLSWLRKMVKYTSRLCHLGQIVTILLLGGSLILNIKPMQIHPNVSWWWTVRAYTQFKLNLY